MIGYWEEQAAEKGRKSPFWEHVGFLLEQFRGLEEGTRQAGLAIPHQWLWFVQFYTVLFC